MGGAVQFESRAAAIVSVAEMTEEAVALLQPHAQPLEYIGVLMDKKMYPDAVRFLAHALPKREAVWWAWMCARKSSGDNPPPKIKAALTATEKWIADPSDVNRRAAMEAAETAEFATAAGCAGLAAFFSGESLAPPDLPPVPPGEFLPAKAVSGAVLCAAMGGDPKETPERFQNYISQAIDVTNRIKLWQQRG
jgi:hypothetical protein